MISNQTYQIKVFTLLTIQVKIDVLASLQEGFSNIPVYTNSRSLKIKARGISVDFNTFPSLIFTNISNSLVNLWSRRTPTLK